MSKLSPEDLVAQVRGTDDLDLLVVRLTLSDAADQDDRLPEAIRLSALPRVIDAELLGTLRGDDDRTVSEHLLGLMVGLGLVTGPLDRLSFHDVTRSALLRDWRQADPDRFLNLNDTLRYHFEARLEELLLLSGEFSQVSRTIRKVNSRRWGRLNSELETRIAACAREAAYHGFTVSADDGMSVLTRQFWALVQAARITASERLMDEARSQVQGNISQAGEDADDLQLERQAIVAYLAGWAARQAEPDSRRAEEIAQLAVADVHLPDQYRLWALDDLAGLYEERMELGSALPLRIELAHQVADKDAWNAPLWAYSLGLLHWRLLERGDAVTELQRSVALADGDGSRTDLRLAALIYISQLQLEQGDLVAAGAAAAEAFDLARTEFGSDRDKNKLMAETVAGLLNSFDVVASEAAYVEARELTEDGSQERMNLLVQRVYVLLATGATGRVDVIRSAVRTLYRDHGDQESDPGDRELVLALEAEIAGEYAEADEKYAAAYTQSTRGRGTANQLDALTGRMRCTLGLGRWAETKKVSKQLRSIVEATGSAVRLALLDVDAAQLALSRGDLDRSAALLSSIDARLLSAGTWQRWLYWRTLAELQTAQADWAGATATLELARDLHRSRGDRIGELEVLRKLLRIAEEQSSWARYAALTAQLAELSVRTAAEADWAFSDDQLEAQRRNASAVRELTDPTGNRLDALLAARSQLEWAVGHDPGCCWYRLNLSYVLADQAEWGRAASELQRALGDLPGPLRGGAFVQRLVAYACEEALGAAASSPAAALAALVERTSPYGSQTTPDALRRLGATGALLAAMAGDTGQVVAMAGWMGPPTEATAAIVEAVAHRCQELRRDGLDLWTPELHWRVVDALETAAARGGDTAMAANLSELRRALDPFIARWLGTGQPATDGDSQAAPLQLEVDEELRPLVDQDLDGGRFMVDLLRGMRDRIRADTGLVVPGLRASLGTNLPPCGFRLLLDEIEVDIGAIPQVPVTVVAYDHDAHAESDFDLLPWHPVDHRVGPWVLALAGDAEDPDELVAPELILLERVERMLRQNLHLFTGPDYIDWALDQAMSADETEPAMLAEVLRDDTARLRFSWLIEDLITNGVPARLGSLLPLIHQAGGLEVGSDRLTELVRASVRTELPGNEPHRTRVSLPAEAADARLLVEAGPAGERARMAYRNWLRSLVASDGPWLAVVVPSADLRAVVAGLSRSEEPLVAVLTEAEVAR